MFPGIDILGYRISSRGLGGDVDRALDLLSSAGSCRYMACANPHSLVVASRDPLFRTALQNADILVPDGSGIVFAACLLSLPLKERVAGYEFFIELSKRGEERGGLRHFFLGSGRSVLDGIAGRFGRDFPASIVCGTYSPPFKTDFSEEDNRTMISAVNSSRPDVLWVGMTAPKQEKWIYENRARIEVPFIGAIGAAFDFYAGTRKRSSSFWRKTGLEWLPRLARDPIRLWRRNFVSTPIFLAWIMREKAGQMLSGPDRRR